MKSMIKIYGVDTTNSEFNWEHLDPEEDNFNALKFINLAEEQGNVWSLEGFQKQFNSSLITHNMLEHMYIYITQIWKK